MLLVAHNKELALKVRHFRGFRTEKLGKVGRWFSCEETALTLEEIT